MWLHQSWSGDLINAVISYLPKGTSADVLSYWYQRRAARSSTTASASARRPRSRCIAHRFLNYMLDPKVAYDELRRLRRLPAAAERDRRRAAVRRAGSCRRTLRNGGGHPRGLRQRQRVPDAVGHGPAAVGQRLGDLPQRLTCSARIWAAAGRCPALRLAGGVLPGRLLRDRRASGWATSPSSTSRCRTGTRSTGTSATSGRRSRTSCPGGRTWDVFVRTLLYVVVAVVLSLAIGYPVAYYASRHAGRWRGAAARRCSCCRSGSAT